MEFLDTILKDSIRQGCFIGNDYAVIMSAPSTLLTGVLWLSLIKKNVIYVEFLHLR